MHSKNEYKKSVYEFSESEHEFCKSMLEKKYKDAYAKVFDMHRSLFTMRNFAKRLCLKLNPEYFDSVYKETDAFTECYIGLLELLAKELLDKSNDGACQE